MFLLVSALDVGCLGFEVAYVKFVMTNFTFSQRGYEQDAHTATAGTIAEDGDFVGIAAECADVALYPAQRLDLIVEGEVARHSPIAARQ